MSAMNHWTRIWYTSCTSFIPALCSRANCHSSPTDESRTPSASSESVRTHSVPLCPVHLILSVASTSNQSSSLSSPPVAPAGILYYDHLITFGDEVRQVWSRPKRAGAYWFFFSRYFAFFTNLAAMVSQNAKFGMSPQVRTVSCWSSR